MLNFIFNIAICNMLGGRWADIAGKDFIINGRLLFRCLATGLMAFFLALDNGMALYASYIAFAVTIGSALWYPFGWSFAEQHGQDDPTKYPSWVRWIGNKIFPQNVIRRAILMKGIRGSFDILTFALLSFINPYAMVWWLGTFSMGAVYWLAAKITPGDSKDAMTGEFMYGSVRGFLIGMAILGGVSVG